MQLEAGIQRQTEAEVSAVAIGDIAVAASAFVAGGKAAVKGFLAGRRRMGTQQGAQLVLHVTHIKPIQHSD